MKHSENREIDLLLRRLARREDARASHSFDDEGNSHDDASHKTGGGEAHMDADELNAYAENALPAQARARYVSHLADCDRCRRLVTELALAANVAGELERSRKPQEAQPSSSWWSSLTVFFALPAVRYGLPALALLAVISVLFFAARQGYESKYVARNEQQPQAGGSQPVAPENKQAPERIDETGPVASSNANSVSNNNSRPATTRRTGTESTDAKSDEVEEEAGQTGADAPVLAQKRASEPVTVENERQQQRPPEGNFSIDGPARVGQAKTETPAAVQPSPSLAREDDRDAQRETTAKAKAQDRLEDRPGYAGAAKPKDNEDSELAADRASGVMGKSAPMTAARRGRRSEEVRRDKEVARGGGEPKASSATRRVGGRTFQRQGDAWVDTAYSSTSATTNVARGSEQYRALVADEPELRQIAEQLSGEVIVVWKGRAYRIR